MISKLSSFLGGVALTVALSLPAFAESKNEAVVQAFMQDMINKGKDLEKAALARAVELHLDHRILVLDNKTVVFG